MEDQIKQTLLDYYRVWNTKPTDSVTLGSLLTRVQKIMNDNIPCIEHGRMWAILQGNNIPAQDGEDAVVNFMLRLGFELILEQRVEYLHSWEGK
jgi:hypothetical protein